MRCICVKTVSLGSKIRLAPHPPEKTNTFEVAGLAFRARQSLRLQPLIDVPSAAVDIAFEGEGFANFHRQRARLGDTAGVVLTSVAARLHPSGLLKLFYSYELPAVAADWDAAQLSLFNSQIIQNTEAEGPIYRRLFAVLETNGFLEDDSLLPFDVHSADAPPEDAFDKIVYWSAWHSTHYLVGDVDPLGPAFGADESTRVTGALPGAQEGAQVAVYQLHQSMGRFVWQLPMAVEAGAEVLDLLDVATTSMDRRTILDVGRANAIALASDLNGYLKAQRSRSLGGVLEYQVAMRARLAETEQLATATPALLRALLAHAEHYYKLDKIEAAFDKDFATLKLAVEAEVQRRDDRFSTVVTLVALAFAALSVVSTTAAVVEYYDYRREILNDAERIWLIVASALAGFIAVLVAIGYWRRH